MAQRQGEFLERGGRVYGLSADSPAQNSAVMEKLALPFPILSDEGKEAAVRPLGFDDEADPRQISRPGVVIVSPGGEVTYRYVGRDFADRPDEDEILAALAELGLPATTQEVAAPGPAEAGPTAIPIDGVPFYLKGAKFANMALRSRHRDISDDFKDDTKAYVTMVDRYLGAISGAEERKA
jgi:hypothetical protein